MGTIRRTKELEATAAELELIRIEDLPRQTVSTRSKTFNTERKKAVENYNLIDSACLAVRATLERKESRSQYLWVEYPDIDDENRNCMLVASKDGDRILFEKHQPNEG